MSTQRLKPIYLVPRFTVTSSFLQEAIFIRQRQLQTEEGSRLLRSMLISLPPEEGSRLATICADQLTTRGGIKTRYDLCWSAYHHCVLKVHLAPQALFNVSRMKRKWLSLLFMIEDNHVWLASNDVRLHTTTSLFRHCSRKKWAWTGRDA